MVSFVRPFAWIFAVAIATVAVASPACAALHAGDVAPPLVLHPAKGPVDARAFAGKPYYINFFASWCPPCNAEAPSVAALYRKYRTRGLAIVGVDEQEDTTKALAFAKKYGWPFAIGVDDGDAAKAYGAFALPVHVFVDRAGKVSTYRLGEMEPNEIEDAIKKIL